MSSIPPAPDDVIADLRRRLAEEQGRSREVTAALEDLKRAYDRVVPHQMLELLAKSAVDVRVGDQAEHKMTVAFCDVRGYTTLCERMSPKENLAFLNSFLCVMWPPIARNGGVIDKYIGDAIMALYPSSADDALRGAIAMFAALGVYNEGRGRAGYPEVRIGIGLNTGIVMLGAVGAPDRMEATVISDAVNLAARLESTTKVYETPLLVSEQTLNNLREPERYSIRFLDRIRVKGKVHPQSVYEVFDIDPPALREAKRATRSTFELALAFYHLHEVRRAIPLLEECQRAAPDDRGTKLYLERCREFERSGTHTGTGEAGTQLDWNPAFEVGVAAIDDQHRELLRHMNLLSDRVRRGAPELRVSLDFLANYAVEHFETEDALMRANGYPFIEEHRHEHARFSECFRQLEREIASGQHDPLYLVFRVQLFLVDWIVNHSTATDLHLGRWLRDRAAGGSADSVTWKQGSV